MIHNLKPYPADKDSGVPWLGDVPEHWEVSRIKAEFHCLNRRRVLLSGTERGAMPSNYLYRRAGTGPSPGHHS